MRASKEQLLAGQCTVEECLHEADVVPVPPYHRVILHRQALRETPHGVLD